MQVRAEDADGDSTPGTVRPGIAGQITDRVLVRQLVRDLRVDIDEIHRPLGHEEAAACFLGELSKTEFSIGSCVSSLWFFEAEADRIDDCLRTLRRIQEMLERDQAGRVFTVREHDDHLAPNVIAR